MTVESEQWTVTTDDGVRLVGERYPAATRGAPVVLALHGITANRLWFLPLAHELAGEVELLTYDARGRGLSDKPTEPERYGHRRHAEDAAQVLQDQAPERSAIVVGQSMGAWDGLQLAAHHPDLVRALVLGDGGYFPDLAADESPADHVAAVMGAGWLDRLLLTLPSREVALAAFRGLPPFAELWDAQVETMLLAGLEERPDGSLGFRCSPVAAEYDSVDYYRPFGELPYVRSDLALVRCPVHLVRAERGFDMSPETVEALLSEAAVEEFARAVRQLTVETVPDTNHFSVNFGPRGVTALAEAVRKALA